MVAWLVAEGVTHVAMEATGVYWKPVFHALYAAEQRLEVVLVNAQHVKNVPGRKTDVKDAEWLAQLMECGLLRGSFIPPPGDRRDPGADPLPQEAGRGADPGTATAVQGPRGCRDQAGLGGVRDQPVGPGHVAALIAGERDPAVLAELARGTMRRKIPDLTPAAPGRFAAHHALMCLHLDHIDHLNAMIERLDPRRGGRPPFRRAARAAGHHPGGRERPPSDHRRVG